MVELYDYPEYYEIAFSFRNIKKEVDVFEDCISRFSFIPVKSVLEIASGNSPHMQELVKRGYKYTGMEINEKMLEYSRKKAGKYGLKVNLVQADMLSFSLKSRVDFVYITLGSLSIKNTLEFMKHLYSISQVLKPGGLYFLDWCIQFEQSRVCEGGDNWKIKRNGIEVRTSVSWKSLNPSEQIFKEESLINVNDHGKKYILKKKKIHKAIYPDEFQYLISNFRYFEFIGWWNNWNLKKELTKVKKINRPITVIRRI